MTNALIRWSVEHPHAIIAFYLGIFLMFVSALPFIPLRMMPYVESPMIAVITRYPGMTPREIETYLSKPIEEKMTDVQGVRYIRSSSMSGLSIVSLEFPYGWDMKKAYNAVQEEVQIAQGDLPYDPANLKPPWVIPIDPTNLPVISLALTSGTWDPIKLREFADNTVVSALKTVPEVESVFAFGGLKRQAQVVVNRDKLAAYGLSILSLKKTLDAYNLDTSGGTLTYGSNESVVRYEGRLRSGDSLSGIVISKGKDGKIVYLRDVARQSDTYAEQRSAYFYNGKPAIQVSVVQNPWESSPKTISAVVKKITALESSYPGLHLADAFDRAHFVKIIEHNTWGELLAGVLLTSVVLFIFLGEWRGTLMALVTIPTSLGIAILLFFPFNMSLNSSTLIGLLLAIGRLVDDSIIDLHNVQRHLKMGKSPKDAAIDGCSEVRGAVVAVTFMLILVLLPMIFAGGLVGEMFIGINIPFILAISASLLVSMTLTPLLAAYVFPPFAEMNRDWSEKLTSPFLRFLESLETRYHGVVGWALRNKGTVMAIVAAFLVIPWFLYPRIGQEMMPLADVGQAYLEVEAWPGTSLEKTVRMAGTLNKILLSHPEVRKVSMKVGNEPGGTYFTGYGMGGVNTITAMVTFSDKSERKKNIWTLIHEVHQEVNRSIPGIRRFNFKEMGSDVMASSRAPIDVLIYGKDLKKLSELAEAAKRLVESDPNLHQVSTSWSYSEPEYDLRIDPALAGSIGLTPNEIAKQAYYALNGGFTREYFNPPLVRHDTFLIRYRQSDRKDLPDLGDVKITTPDGKEVPLKSVAEIVKNTGPSVIEHDNLRRSIDLMAYYRKGGPGSMALTSEIMMKSLLQLPFPPGYGMEMRGDMTQMMDSFTRLYKGMGLALIFVFLSLAVQFRSFGQSFTMMLAIPLELVGSLLALIFGHQTFSTVSILGFVFLNGIAVTASILVVDFITTLREEGVEREKAIADGATIRLRPILMTVGIALVVLIPATFFPKTGEDAYAPLGAVMVGGLVMSTVLSLIAVPVMYSLMDDAIQWVRRTLSGLGIGGNSHSVVQE